MKRICFLDNCKTKDFFSENLRLFFFGKIKISYGICKKCGLIIQNKTVAPKLLKKYYDHLTVAFDNFYKPTQDKIKSVKRHINIVKDEIKKFPSSVLEVGVFNTYNLKQFKKNGSKIVNGLEPSKKVSDTINSSENIKIFCGNIENFNFKINYDLIIMSHVLEHFYDPLKVLKKCFKSQKNGQYLLLEVPLFENINDYPNGAFHLEHLNYFNEKNFIMVIEKAGYKPVYISKTSESTAFPFLTVIAKKTEKKIGHLTYKKEWFPHLKSYKNLRVIDVKENKKKDFNYFNQLQNAKNYLKRNKLLWNAIDKKINKFDKKKPIYIYGAGFHGSQLLNYTNVEKKFEIIGFLDSSVSKHKQFIGNYKIFSPYDKKLNFKSNIIISSIYSEKNIHKSLNFLRKRGIRTYRLYE